MKLTGTKNPFTVYISPTSNGFQLNSPFQLSKVILAFLTLFITRLLSVKNTPTDLIHFTYFTDQTNMKTYKFTEHWTEENRQTPNKYHMKL